MKYRLIRKCDIIQDSLPIANTIIQEFTEGLRRIANLINRIIDFDESEVVNRCCVKLGVDPTLDEYKMTFNNVPNYMTTVARQELDRLDPNIVESCSVIYLPQIGYLLQVVYKF